jgi:hypothetical protein
VHLTFGFREVLTFIEEEDDVVVEEEDDDDQQEDEDPEGKRPVKLCTTPAIAPVRSVAPRTRWTPLYVAQVRSVSESLA